MDVVNFLLLFLLQMGYAAAGTKWQWCILLILPARADAISEASHQLHAAGSSFKQSSPCRACQQRKISWASTGKVKSRHAMSIGMCCTSQLLEPLRVCQNTHGPQLSAGARGVTATMGVKALCRIVKHAAKQQCWDCLVTLAVRAQHVPCHSGAQTCWHSNW